jgi:hypothetical protein
MMLEGVYIRVPSSRSLLKLVKNLPQSTHLMLSSLHLKPFWLYHENNCFELTIQESRLHIKLFDPLVVS